MLSQSHVFKDKLTECHLCEYDQKFLLTNYHTYINCCFTLTEPEALSSCHIKDDYLETSSDAKSCVDREEPIAMTSQYDVNISTSITQEDEEDKEGSEEFLDCVEWNDDVCVATGSIEPECLIGLELMLTSKAKERACTCTLESSLHDKLNRLKQDMANMVETNKLLKADLQKENVLLKELEQDRNMLAKRTKYHESNELKLLKMVEDLKRQNVVLTDLVTGAKQHPKKIKG